MNKSVEGPPYDNGDPITIWAPTSINQSASERLSELIRAGGIVWKRVNDPKWRDKPWTDGIIIDLDESSVVQAIVDHILSNSDPNHQGDSR